MDIGQLSVLLLGFLVVLATSLGKFDEPSYGTSRKKSKSNYRRNLYNKFRPKFVTSRSRFAFSRALYVLLMEAVYLAIALGADVGETLALMGANVPADKIVTPLFAAVVVVGGQNAIYVNNIERMFRKWCHGWAKIPAGASRTVEKLKGATFDYSPYLSNETLRSDEFRYVTPDYFKCKDRTTEEKWTRICCILYSINRARSHQAQPNEFSSSDYDDELFDEYAEEFDQIIRSHRALGPAMDEFEKRKREDNDWLNSDDFITQRKTLHEDLDDLLGRLFSFVACAVRSKIAKESDIEASLRKIGFEPDELSVQLDRDQFVILFGVSFGIVLISVIFSSLIFDPEIANVKERIPELDFIMPPFIPARWGDALRWAITLVAAHGCAIWIAQWYRARKISKPNSRWTERFHESRDRRSNRPLAQYAIVFILGSFAGFVGQNLIGWALLSFDQQNMKWMLDAFAEASSGSSKALLTLQLIGLGLYWAPVFGVSALFYVIHLDTVEDSWRDQVLGTASQAIASFVVTYYVASGFVPAMLSITGMGYISAYARLGELFGLFVAGVNAIISGFMGFYIPRFHLKILRRDALERERAEVLELHVEKMALEEKKYAIGPKEDQLAFG